MGLTTLRGDIGERAAAEWLRQRGFVIEHLKWRSGRYDLDIVARRGERLHFVEVKTRRKGGLTTPEQAMTRAKFTALCHAARAYIECYGLDMECQFDLAAVELCDDGSCRIRYLPEAMYPRW